MLSKEIESAQRKVKTDAYQMSIGELINMYRTDELIINPDFQRLFRWNLDQKSRLIESILLGIPIPSIFVFETDDGSWELIDGLQRVSTILEFCGELKSPETGDLLPPSSLIATKYLSQLKNTVWTKSSVIAEPPLRKQKELDKSLKFAIRRNRIGVEILKRPSDNSTKYDLFQRLNAGGSAANPQELRNCIIIMVNKSYFDLIKSLANNEDFKKIISASEDQLDKQKDMEYASRFLVYTYVDYVSGTDVENFIDEGIIHLSQKGELSDAEYRFSQTFKLLNAAYGENSLKRYVDGKHTGRVGLAAFESIAVGISKNIHSIMKKKDPVTFIRNKIDKFWVDDSIAGFFASGLRGTVRIQRTIPFGLKWFSK